MKVGIEGRGGDKAPLPSPQKNVQGKKILTKLA